MEQLCIQRTCPRLFSALSVLSIVFVFISLLTMTLAMSLLMTMTILMTVYDHDHAYNRECDHLQDYDHYHAFDYYHNHAYDHDHAYYHAPLMSIVKAIFLFVLKQSSLNCCLYTKPFPFRGQWPYTDTGEYEKEPSLMLSQCSQV